VTSIFTFVDLEKAFESLSQYSCGVCSNLKVDDWIDSAKGSCGVCLKGVGSNSICCNSFCMSMEKPERKPQTSETLIAERFKDNKLIIILKKGKNKALLFGTAFVRPFWQSYCFFHSYLHTTSKFLFVLTFKYLQSST